MTVLVTNSKAKGVYEFHDILLLSRQKLSIYKDFLKQEIFYESEI